MTGIVYMHQRVRFTLSASGKAKLASIIVGNGAKTLTQVGPDRYEATLYDVITIFGRQMPFRRDKTVTRPKADCVFGGECIEVMPLNPNQDTVFRDGD